MEKKIILRRKTEDSEGDKYEYFVSCKNGIEVTTPFKDKATVIIEGSEVQVSNKDWRAIRFKEKSFKQFSDEVFEFNKSIGIGTPSLIQWS